MIELKVDSEHGIEYFHCENCGAVVDSTYALGEVACSCGARYRRKEQYKGEVTLFERV